MRFTRTINTSTRSATILLAVGLVAVLPKACAADNPPPGSGSRTIHSCSPDYTDENKLGRLSVQQKGPGASIQWGAYPKLDADKYVVMITIGGVKVDGKNQSYPPHGSLSYLVWNKKRTKQVPRYHSGQIFKISGTSYTANGAVVQKFFIKCKLA
jgi:hypothetical protein